MAKKKEVSRDLGSLIDELYARRAERLEAERAAEELKKAETVLKGEIFDALRAAKLSGAKGAVATCSITTKRTFRLAEGDGWAKFWEFARKDKLGVFVQKRIATNAIGEYVGAGKQVPGVTPEDVLDLSLTRVGAS